MYRGDRRPPPDFPPYDRRGGPPPPDYGRPPPDYARPGPGGFDDRRLGPPGPALRSGVVAVHKEPAIDREKVGGQAGAQGRATVACRGGAGGRRHCCLPACLHRSRLHMCLGCAVARSSR